MLKHIVMWKLKEFAEGKTKAENALIMKESLERLVGIVPEIISLQVGYGIRCGLNLHFCQCRSARPL